MKLIHDLRHDPPNHLSDIAGYRPRPWWLTPALMLAVAVVLALTFCSGVTVGHGIADVESTVRGSAPIGGTP